MELLVVAAAEVVFDCVAALMRNEAAGMNPKFRQIRIFNIQGDTEQAYDNYKHFMDQYGPLLRTVVNYNTECADKVPEDWLTLWEEAFGLFMLENYHTQMVTWVGQNLKINSAYAIQGTAKRNQGYSADGMKRWKQLLHEVQDRRKSEANKRMTFGRRYMEEKKAERKKKGERGTKRKLDSTEEREKAYKEACGDDDALFDGLKYDKIVVTSV